MPEQAHAPNIAAPSSLLGHTRGTAPCRIRPSYKKYVSCEISDVLNVDRNIFEIIRRTLGVDHMAVSTA